MDSVDIPANEPTQAFIAKARSLLGEEYLPKIERCLERLSDDEVWWRANEESNSIGNLLLHLAGNARQWIVCGIGGAGDQRMRQQEFDERSIVTRSELLARIKGTLAEVDGVLADFDVSRILEQRQIQGCEVTVFDAIFHVVEHFAVHTGQIILLTKMLKGVDMKFYDFSGDAPAPGWNKSLKSGV
ncbi:MAG: hypothetical protein QOJ02_2775 [Acidobacteriota bacterium]|jgi:uncharacterized damage-inducible protein DinB|nr:hypothetical protein [Acidobacteriota bacterium]